MWKKYLLWFAQENVEFRIAEIESLISLFKLEMRYKEKPKTVEPYWIVEFSSENDAKQLASRSVSLRSCLELWGHENSIETLHNTLQTKMPLLVPEFNSKKSFKIEVETFGRHFTQQEKVNKIERFSYLPVRCPVDLKNPDICLQYIEYYGLRAKDPPKLPYNVFFGKWRREPDESIRTNMEQYNLGHRYLDVLVNDFAMVFWKDSFEFDAVISDPPYGIRESTERVGTIKEDYVVSEKHLATHIPAKIEYGIPSIYRDLLVFSARRLKIGGRLVCWFPVFREDYMEQCLPSHRCLKLVANDEQILSKVTSRRLLTYEKTRHPAIEEPSLDERSIPDFRERYFVARDETRKERRLREATERKENWEKYRKNQKKDP